MIDLSAAPSFVARRIGGYCPMCGNRTCYVGFLHAPSWVLGGVRVSRVELDDFRKLFPQLTSKFPGKFPEISAFLRRKKLMHRSTECCTSALWKKILHFHHVVTNFIIYHLGSIFIHSNQSASAVNREGSEGVPQPTTVPPTTRDALQHRSAR